MHTSSGSSPNQFRVDGSNSVSPTQSTQLVESLRQRKRNLDRDEAEFRIRVMNWESNAAQQQQAVAEKQRQLNEKEEALRKLQFQMLELQNQIIESQLALESIVAKVQQPVSPNDQIAGLEMLRSELFDRFDFVEDRWESMVAELRQVASQITQAMKSTKRIELD